MGVAGILILTGSLTLGVALDRAGDGFPVPCLWGAAIGVVLLVIHAIVGLF